MEKEDDKQFEKPKLKSVTKILAYIFSIFAVLWILLATSSRLVLIIFLIIIIIWIALKIVNKVKYKKPLFESASSILTLGIVLIISGLIIGFYNFIMLISWGGQGDIVNALLLLVGVGLFIVGIIMMIKSRKQN